MATTTTAAPQRAAAADEHVHGTLPPAAMAALVGRTEVPEDADFEAWEDGAYVLAYVRRNQLA